MSYLILGASTGLGRELAYILAKNSNDLIIISRDERDLKAIKSDLEIKFKI
ncbi:MAG: short-chain dehydrogenase, partial [Candidatus Pelagibacter sp.]|nr:short-chain dehydrogenase [Candidatus Pelagibacter sp.]